MCPPSPGPHCDTMFNGTDEQAVICLDRFMRGSPLPAIVLEDINPYQYEPSNLPERFWYLVNSAEKKQNEFGAWEVKEQASEVFSNTSISGWRTTLEFQDSLKRRTGWLMREYKIMQKGLCGNYNEKQPMEICQVFLSAARSSDTGTQSGTKGAVVAGTNHARIVPSRAPGIESASEQGSSSRSMMRHGADGTRSPLDAVLLGPRMRDYLDYIFDGDYLEVNDLAGPESCLSSSVNISCSSMSSDEYFDSDALLQELEDNDSRGQTNDRSTRFHVTESIRPFEVVVQPATSACAIGSSIDSSAVNKEFPDKRTSDHSKFPGKRISDHTTKRPNTKQRDKDPSCSHNVVVSPNINMRISKGEKKAAIPKTKGLKKYFCFMPF